MTRKEKNFVEFKYCECGCGFTLPLKNKNGPLKYVRGHSNKGKKLSEEYRLKISESLKGRFADEKHPAWKGNDVDNSVLHRWVRRHLQKPKYCEICGIVEPKEVANFNGKYVKDIIYWWWLCIPCHRRYDLKRETRII